MFSNILLGFSEMPSPVAHDSGVSTAQGCSSDNHDDPDTCPQAVVFIDTTDCAFESGIEDHSLCMPYASPGDVFWHAFPKVHELHRLFSIPIFQVGITTSPDIRFQSYKEGNWSAMWIVLASSELGPVEELEIKLISSLGALSECRNIRGGGGGGLRKCFLSAQRFLTYIVGAPADQGCVHG